MDKHDIHQGMITVSEFARVRKEEPDRVIRKIKEGHYVGQLVEDRWYIHKRHLTKQTAGAHETEQPPTAFMRGMSLGAPVGAGLVGLLFFYIIFRATLDCLHGSCTALLGDEDEISMLVTLPFLAILLAIPAALAAGLVGGTISVVRELLGTGKVEFRLIDKVWLVVGLVVTVVAVHQGAAFVSQEKRARVVDAVQSSRWAVFDILKGIAGYHARHGEWPQSLEVLEPWSTRSTGYRNYISKVELISGGVLIAHLKGKEELEGHSLKFTPVPRGGGMYWVCEGDAGLDPIYWSRGCTQPWKSPG